MLNDPDDRSFIRDLWSHPMGRVLLVGATVAIVSWALRETAVVTTPIFSAVGDVLVPLLIGFTIAYVLTPIVDAFSRHGLTRLVATFLIFLVFIAGSALAIGLGLPAMISQSSEIIDRTVHDQVHLDADRDSLQDRHEFSLLPMPGKRGQYFHDRNDNGEWDDGEPIYREGKDPVRVTPSIARRVADWFGETQSRVQRFVGYNLDDEALAFLAFYDERTAAFRAVLDQGLVHAENGLALDQWSPQLQIDPADLPSLELQWNRAWPGVLPDRFEAAAVNLPDDETRTRWRAIMSRYGNLFVHRHRQLLSAWSLVQSGVPNDAEAPSGPATSTDDKSGAVEIDPNVDADKREQILEDIKSLVSMRAKAAQPLLQTLENDGPAQLAKALLDYRMPLGDAEEEQRTQFFEALQAADDADQAFARSLFRSLIRNADEEVVDVLLEHLNDQVRTSVTKSSEDLTSALGSSLSVGGVLNFSLNVVLVPIYAFFLTLAMPGVRSTVRRYLPARNRERSIRLLHDIERVVAAFFRGRLIVCLICGILVSLGFLILGVPYAVLFGFLIGLATTVPLSGLLFLIPAVVLTVMEGGNSPVLTGSLIVAVYAIVQTLEMTVFTPTIMGREVELHPVVLIVALLLCGKLLGIIGLIMAVPIAATLRILAREFVLPRLRAFVDLPADSALWTRVSGKGGQQTHHAEVVRNKRTDQGAEPADEAGLDDSAAHRPAATDSADGEDDALEPKDR